MRFLRLLGNTVHPTSVSPKGLPPSPQGEGFSQKYGAGFSELSPLLLERVAPKGPGVEGTRCNFRTARKEVRPHIRHAKRRDTL